VTREPLVQIGGAKKAKKEEKEMAMAE